MRRLVISVDETAESPLEWRERLGELACWHSRHVLGDLQPIREPQEWLVDLAGDVCPGWWRILGPEDELDDGPEFRELTAAEEQMVEYVLQRFALVLPLWFQDYGAGVRLHVARSEDWERRQIGYAWCSLKKARDWWCLGQEADWGTKLQDGRTLRQAAKDVIAAEVEMYEHWLNGQVYGYVLEERSADGTWRTVDSCWGFYGDDPRTNGMADALGEDAHLLEEAIYEFA